MPTGCQVLPERRKVRVTGSLQAGNDGCTVWILADTNWPFSSPSGATALGAVTRISSPSRVVVPVALSNRDHVMTYSDGAAATPADWAALANVSVPSGLSAGSTMGFTPVNQVRNTLSRRWMSVLVM